MDRERQTLELLQLLGDEVAEAVLGRLQPERAQKLRASLKADTPHRSTISRQREVLDEFECFFQFALRSQPEPVPESGADQLSGSDVNSADPSAEPASQLSDLLNTASTSTATEVTAASTSDEANRGSGEPADSAPNTDDNESNPESEESMPAISSVPVVDDPLRDLQTLSVHQLAQAMSSEQPRTTAFLLSSLPPKLTGDILNLLKPEYQKLVMKELTKEQQVPAVLLERIARATFLRARQFSADPPDTRNHADRVAEVLRSVPRAGRRNMLAAIEEQDPELAKSLLTKIYRFDDLTSLNKTVIQRVLGEVHTTNLTTALFGADESVKDAIFANLSKRARQTIEEEMQFTTNVSEARIQQAREGITEIIARIDMESEA